MFIIAVLTSTLIKQVNTILKCQTSIIFRLVLIITGISDIKMRIWQLHNYKVTVIKEPAQAGWRCIIYRLVWAKAIFTLTIKLLYLLASLLFLLCQAFLFGVNPVLFVIPYKSKKKSKKTFNGCGIIFYILHVYIYKRQM